MSDPDSVAEQLRDEARQELQNVHELLAMAVAVEQGDLGPEGAAGMLAADEPVVKQEKWTPADAHYCQGIADVQEMFDEVFLASATDGGPATRQFVLVEPLRELAEGWYEDGTRRAQAIDEADGEGFQPEPKDMADRLHLCALGLEDRLPGDSEVIG